MPGLVWSVMNTWNRWPSVSVKVSWAPGWGSSRRAIARVPTGQRDRSLPCQKSLFATPTPDPSQLLQGSG